MVQPHPPVPTTLSLSLPLWAIAWGHPGGTKGMVTATRHPSPSFPPTCLSFKSKDDGAKGTKLHQEKSTRPRSLCLRTGSENITINLARRPSSLMEKASAAFRRGLCLWDEGAVMTF